MSPSGFYSLSHDMFCIQSHNPGYYMKRNMMKWSKGVAERVDLDRIRPVKL